MVENYVSVTAGKDLDEVNAVIDGFRNNNYFLDDKLIPAIGIQVSEKSLNGIKMKNFRFAEFKDVPLFMESIRGNVMPVIHYNTRNLETLPEQISRVFENIYNDCRLLQLNVTFPDVAHLGAIKERFPDLKISLQVDYRGKDIDTVVEKIFSYGDCLDYVLIDPSIGRGLGFDVEYSTSLYSKIKDRQPDCGIIFAGGFSGENVESILNQVIDKIKTKDFSICAEGQLRDKISDEFFGHDVLNVEKMEKYLKVAKKVLG